jgi:hypothetical protein
LKIFWQTLVEKTPPRPLFRRGLQDCQVHKWLTFRNRILFEIFQADLEFKFSTRPCFKNFNRDHDRDRKIDPDQSNLDLKFSTGP